MLIFLRVDIQLGKELENVNGNSKPHIKFIVGTSRGKKELTFRIIHTQIKVRKTKEKKNRHTQTYIPTKKKENKIARKIKTEK